MEEKLLRTPLYDWHVSHHAKMAPFAGFEMPISYPPPAGEVNEIKAVRTKAGLFDISHMGQIFVSGSAAREFLDLISVRDLSKLVPGMAKYTLACDHQGRPIDDLIIYQLPCKMPKGEESFLVVSNASNYKRIFSWLKGVRKGFRDYMGPDETLRMSDDSDAYALIALQGPLSENILMGISVYDELPTKNYSCAYTFVADYHMLVLRSGYTGEDGFEIVCPVSYAEDVWKALIDEGSNYGMLPCGLASRDVLRLEAGMPLFGHEVDADHDPVSAGLGRYVECAGRKFIGSDALAQIKSGNVIKPKLHAFVMEKGRIPRAGCAVLSGDGLVKIGYLTSAGPSPTLGKNIALGYLHTSRPEGSEVLIEIGGKGYPAVVTKAPFYKAKKK